MLQIEKVSITVIYYTLQVTNYKDNGVVLDEPESLFTTNERMLTPGNPLLY